MAKEGTIHALVQYRKIGRITERNLKMFDDAAAGSAPVLDKEMSEILAPSDNVERSTRVHQWTQDSPGVDASTPKQLP